MSKRTYIPLLLTTLVHILVQGAVRAESSPTASTPVYSPYVDRVIPRQVFFGDTHHHSSYSVDSGMFGNTLGPDQSFRFARGEEVISSSGIRAKLIRPLDFLVVSDHAEYLGLSKLLAEADPELLATEAGAEWYANLQEGGEVAWLAAVGMMRDFTEGNERVKNPELKRSIWDNVVDIASDFNQPGVFTAFNGYEWSSAPYGNNLHRVVVFRDGPEKVKQVLPFSAFDSLEPEGLWEYMADYESKTGGQVLAIPHNPNISNGAMFAETKSNGQPVDRAYAQMRARWEPLLEVTQMKGDSEAHPLLSPEDEFADYETWDFGNAAAPTVPKTDSMLQHEYARPTLKAGLRFEQELGVNPFKLGMIGSTDNHISLSTTREENFFGKLPSLEPRPDRINDAFIKNADRGYARGVPMGGDLSAAPKGTAPTFMIRALRDPDGANLDRIQVIKGWLDGNGDTRERIYDVAVSDGRKIGKDGRCTAAVGSTVDIARATYDNSIGDAMQTAYWADPDFDPDERAFYYVRVIEIPTPRWTAYDARRFGTEMPQEVRMTVQDRAYTSPVWYTP